jgi:aryl-alcohol dehydrogenase-like predicted oxidoreductase
VTPRPLAGGSAFPVGLGAMPLSGVGRPDRDQAMRTVHAALDAGVTLVDTADAYCLARHDTGHNEVLVAEALASWPGDRDTVVVATKGGHVRGDDGSWALDGRPEHLRAACDASRARLRVDAIDLYQFHRPDPAVPFAESVGAMADLRREGKVRHVGLSNVDVDQIGEAGAIVEVASVQNQLGPDFRTSLGEARRCAELGIAFLAWAPLGGGGSAGRLGELHPAFAEVAAARGVSAQRVAIAWLLAAAPTVVPIPGARRPETILDSVAGAELELDEAELALLGR